MVDWNIYGMPQSLMTFNFKEAKGDVFADELQRMMTVRRDANFYDISPEITTEAIKIAEDMNFTIPSMPVPPSPRGYLRMTINDGVPMVTENGLPRFNAVLWDRETLYMVHDTGGQSPFRIAPVRMQLGFKATPTDYLYDAYQDTSIPIFRHVGMTVLGPGVDRVAVEMVRTSMEEIISITHVLFDMIAETKAITVEHQQTRNVFGSKQRDYFETVRVVKIRLHYAKKKYLKAWHEKTGRTNAWHEVITHFKHYRKPDHECQHHWVPRFADDDGKHYKCTNCTEIKTRVELPNGAGDKTKGKIKHVYEVTG